MKQLLSIIGATAFLATQAQNSNVVSAYNYMQDGNLEKAVEFIEPAITNESTAAKEKTWRYRGDIYRLIVNSDKPELQAKFPDALDKAVVSYLKANEIDTKGSYKQDNVRALGGLQVMALNGGNDAFNNKEYDKAIALYGQSERIAKAFGQVDSNAVYNSALAYESKGDLAGAIGRYKECIAVGYDKPDVYRYLSNLQKRNGDANGALATTQAGRKAHPNDKEIMLDELALLMELGRDAEVEQSLDATIAADPNNVTLRLVKAQIYDQKANPKDGAAVPEADMLKYYGLAEAEYKKAIELDATNFDAPYNVGVLYNNRAAYEYEKCAKVKDDAAYAKCKKAADQIYLNAVPYFEKAHAIKADDKTTIQQLKKLYAITGNTEGFERMKKLLGE